MDKISIIVPCYNEEDSLPLFYKEIDKISKELKKVEFEFLFINDGSKDNTLKLLKELNKKDKRVRYISFSRNFFKEAGIYAGLKEATGDYTVIIDADLQHPPYLIIDMYNSIKYDGYDSVACRRVSRKGEPFLRSLGAKCFYKLMNMISKTEFVDGATDYRMMNRKMTDAVLEISEYNRFTKGIFGWVGFNTKWIEFENVERAAGGKSRIPLLKSFTYAIEAIVSFSTVPLVISAVMGLIFCLISFIMIVVIIAKTIMFGDPTSGWPSLVCIIFLASGIQLFCVGIMGEYLSKMYLETKKRPIYIVKETEKDNKNEK